VKEVFATDPTFKSVIKMILVERVYYGEVEDED
jgi:hypothetical protein